MDQNETWQVGRFRRGHIVLDGHPAPPPQKGHSPQISAHVCCGQTAGLIKMSVCTELNLSPSDIVLDGDPALPRGGHSTPQSWPMYCGQTAVWIKMSLGTDVDLDTGHIVLDGAQPRPPERGTAPTLFGPCLLWPNGPPSQLLLSSYTNGRSNIGDFWRKALGLST